MRRPLLVAGFLAVLVASCSSGPRDPVEKLLDLSKRGLDTASCWVGEEVGFVLRGVTTYRYEAEISGNAIERGRIEKRVEAKEAALPLLEQAVGEATEASLRTPGGSDLPRRRYQALEALRTDIRSDKDRALALLAEPRGGGRYLQFHVATTEAPEGRSYFFRVEESAGEWRVREVIDPGDRQFQPPPADQIARQLLGS